MADLKQLEKSLRRRYVEEAMETTGTTEVAGRMIRNLSKGYRQRVGFAQADHDKIRIYAKKGADVREEVFRQMAEHNVLVLEMKTVTKSLEDVFLEITQEGGAQ